MNLAARSVLTKAWSMVSNRGRPARRREGGPSRWFRPEPLEGRVVMASWLTATSANFATAARWDTGRVPGNTEPAIFQVGGAPYTVTIDRNTTVGLLSINSAAATVNHTAGTFSLQGNRLVRLTAGALNIGPNATFRLDQGVMDWTGGTLTGTVRNFFSTINKSGQTNSPVRFFYESAGRFNATELGPGQTLTIDTPNSVNLTGVIIPDMSNRGRIEFINTNNVLNRDARLQGGDDGRASLFNEAGGVIALAGAGGKRFSGRLHNTAGTVDFGSSIQRFQIDNGVVLQNGTLRMKWNGPSSFDTLDVRGTVNLGGTLQLTVAPNLAIGQSATLIRNDGTDAIFGTFINLPEGSTLTLSGQQFRLSYRGGDGNDVVLTRVNTPSLFPNRSLTNPRGNLAVLSGEAGDPDPGALFRLTVDWGDGTPPRTYTSRPRYGQRIAVPHHYRRAGEYTVSLRWVDQFGEGNSAVMTARVGRFA